MFVFAFLPNSLVMILVMITVPPVPVVVVFAVPVSFVILPAFLVMVVVRMVPVCAFIGSTSPMPGNPAIMMAVGRPVALNPDEARSGYRPAPLIAKWRRRSSDINRNLPEHRNRN